MKSGNNFHALLFIGHLRGGFVQKVFSKLNPVNITSLSSTNYSLSIMSPEN